MNSGCVRIHDGGRKKRVCFVVCNPPSSRNSLECRHYIQADQHLFCKFKTVHDGTSSYWSIVRKKSVGAQSIWVSVVKVCGCLKRPSTPQHHAAVKHSFSGFRRLKKLICIDPSYGNSTDKIYILSDTKGFY